MTNRSPVRNVVYTLEMADFGAIGLNADINGSGPAFTPTQLDMLVAMLNTVPDYKVSIKDGSVVIDNGASGETEVIKAGNNGTFNFDGWSFFKFDEESINSCVFFKNWDHYDVANFLLWLKVNDCTFHFDDEIDEVLAGRALKDVIKKAMSSIEQQFNIVCFYGFIESHPVINLVYEKYYKH